MNATRLLTTLLVLVGCLAGVGYVQPNWAAVVGLDGDSYHQAEQVVENEPFRAEELQRRTEIITKRINAKYQLVQQLIHGKRNLFEVAAWFRYFNETPADCQDDYRTFWPGNSDGEKLCRQVILWTRTELERTAPASRAEEMGRQLERQLEEHLKEHGTVHLPEL